MENNDDIKSENILRKGVDLILNLFRSDEGSNKGDVPQSGVSESSEILSHAIQSSGIKTHDDFSQYFLQFSEKENRKLAKQFQTMAQRFDLQWSKPNNLSVSLKGKQKGIETDNYKENIIKPSTDIKETNSRFCQFYADKAKIPNREWYLSSFVANNILSQLEDNMNKVLQDDSRKGDRSKYSYLRIDKFCVSGSSSDGLKAYRPNEYDVEIPVHIIGKDGHSVIEPIGKQDGSKDVPHGWFKMKLTEPLDIKGNTKEKRLLVEKHDAQWLSTAGLKDKMKSLVQKALNEIPKSQRPTESTGSPWLIQPVVRSDKGPAITINILFGKEMRNKLEKEKMQPMTRISVDLVPRLELAKGKYDHNFQNDLISSIDKKKSSVNIKPNKQHKMVSSIENRNTSPIEKGKNPEEIKQKHAKTGTHTSLKEQHVKTSEIRISHNKESSKPIIDNTTSVKNKLDGNYSNNGKQGNHSGYRHIPVSAELTVDTSNKGRQVPVSAVNTSNRGRHVPVSAELTVNTSNTGRQEPVSAELTVNTFNKDSQVPVSAVNTSKRGRQVPVSAELTVKTFNKGRQVPVSAVNTSNRGRQVPVSAVNTSNKSRQVPVSAELTVNTSNKSRQVPVSAELTVNTSNKGRQVNTSNYKISDSITSPAIDSDNGKHPSNAKAKTSCGKVNNSNMTTGNSSNTSITNPSMCAVAKPCMAGEAQGLDVPLGAGLCQLFFRASFSEYEKSLLDKLNNKFGMGNCSKAVIQTLKTIQTRDDLRAHSSELKSMLSSYHIKTALYHLGLHSTTAQADIEKYWSSTNFTPRIADMCNFIDKSLENRNLPHAMFNNPAATQFDPVFEQLTTLNAPSNVNIFSRMKETTAGNIHRNLGQAFSHQLGMDFNDLCSLGKDGEAAYNWAVSDYNEKA